MSLTFIGAQVKEHEPGAYLGTFVNSSKKSGELQFYFPDQENYLRLLGNDLYLAPTWQYDFETKNVYEQTAKEVVNFYDFSESKTPVKFVYSETDYDWIYAELDFRNVDEGPLTYQGWQSPWAPIVETEKSGTSYIDALFTFF